MLDSVEDFEKPTSASLRFNYSILGRILAERARWGYKQDILRSYKQRDLIAVRENMRQANYNSYLSIALLLKTRLSEWYTFQWTRDKNTQPTLPFLEVRLLFKLDGDTWVRMPAQ